MNKLFRVEEGNEELISQILFKYASDEIRTVGKGCNNEEYILAKDFHRVITDVSKEIEYHKEHLRAAAYTIWKGCESSLPFDEWKENWLKQNKL